MSISGSLPVMTTTNQKNKPTSLVKVWCGFSPGTRPRDYDQIVHERCAYPTKESYLPCFKCQVYTAKYSGTLFDLTSVSQCKGQQCEGGFCYRVGLSRGFHRGEYVLIIPFATCRDAGQYTCRTYTREGFPYTEAVKNLESGFRPPPLLSLSLSLSGYL